MGWDRFLGEWVDGWMFGEWRYGLVVKGGRRWGLRWRDAERDYGYEDDISLLHRQSTRSRALYQSMIKVRTVSKLGYARCNVLPSSIVKVFARM